MKILALGDVMGPPGRNALKKHLLKIIKDNKIDLQKDVDLSEGEINEDEEKTGWWS